MTLLLRGGRVIDPAQGLDMVADVLVEGSRVSAITTGSGMSRPDVEVVDATGKIVGPGLIDAHAHLREPGLEYKEDILSASRAAVKGGYTGVMAMPDTDPPVDNAAMVQFIYTRGRQAGLARVFPVGAVTAGRKGEKLAEIGYAAQAGAVAFSDDGQPIANPEILRRALEYLRPLKRPLIDHCQDANLSARGVMHEGLVSFELGLEGIPSAAEEVAVARDLILAAHTGARIHLAHLSAKGSVSMLAQAKEKGIPVTAEVTPHHLILTHEVLRTYDTNTKVNPPLRTEEDRQALLQALRQGLIDIIATDHAPHASHEKRVDFNQAPFGISGLETALPLVVTYLVKPGYLSWMEAIARMSTNPAQIFGLPGGNLRVGSPADLVVIDPETVKEVRPEDFASKGKNNPFIGQKLSGWPVMTIVGGRIVMRDGEVM